MTALPCVGLLQLLPEFDGAARLFVVRVPRESVDLAAYELAFTFSGKKLSRFKTRCAR